MRTIDPALQSELDTGATTLCYCWRVTRRDGLVIGFTDHDRSLSFDGTMFAPDSGVNATAFSASADLSVDNSEIEGALSSDALSAEDLSAGRFDGAVVEIFRVNWRIVEQRVLIKKAVIGEVARAGEKFTAEIRGLSHILDQTSGRVYQRQCDALVGDARCGVDLTDPQFSGTGSVSAVIDEQRFLADGLQSFDESWFEHGVVTWTNGANNGISAFVKAHGRTGPTASINLWLPLGAQIEIGDQFMITAGCDKRHQTCLEKFTNLTNFRGFHLMPGNDFAVSYPLRSDDNDGGQL